MQIAYKNSCGSTADNDDDAAAVAVACGGGDDGSNDDKWVALPLCAASSKQRAHFDLLPKWW